MSNRVLIYTFPFFLVLMEWLLRVAVTVNSKEFIAPTIAAAGLGLLLPLTAPKNRAMALSETTLRELEATRVVIIPKRERVLIDVVWVLIFLALGAWAVCLVFACKPDADTLKLPHVLYGFVNYGLGVLCSEIKEFV